MAKPIAVLNMEPSEITSKLGIVFETTRDDLDYLKAALVKVESGNQYAFVRHLHAPNTGTDILMNEKRSDIMAALDEVLHALELTSEDLKWIHPDVP